MYSEQFDPEKAVAYLHAQGMPGKEIARRLFPNLKDPNARVSVLLSKARGRFLREIFDESCVSRDELDAMRMHACRDPYVGLQQRLSEKSGGYLKDLRVFYSAPSAANKNTWGAHIARFADNCAWYVRGQLDHSRTGIAVSWGRTNYEVIQALKRHQPTRGGDARKSLRSLLVIPTVGDPLGASLDADGISSTKLARELSTYLTGSSDGVPSLEGIRPVLPRSFSDEKRNIIREYIEYTKGYREVFGARDGNGGSAGKLAAVDTILTGAGAFQSWMKWGSEVMVDAGVPVSELKGFCVGDIGGYLLPLEKVDTDPAAKARYDELTNLWTGITLQHFKAVAERAANGTAPGPVLCAIGANKAKVVHDLVVRFRAVNRLVVDQHLVKALEVL
jgi:hypothetical protein